ncbi:MAG: hypothetical protein M1826_005550, partial [Phylliscum demangeonii]
EHGRPGQAKPAAGLACGRARGAQISEEDETEAEDKSEGREEAGGDDEDDEVEHDEGEKASGVGDLFAAAAAVVALAGRRTRRSPRTRERSEADDGRISNPGRVITTPRPIIGQVAVREWKCIVVTGPGSRPRSLAFAPVRSSAVHGRRALEQTAVEAAIVRDGELVGGGASGLARAQRSATVVIVRRHREGERRA